MTPKVAKTKKRRHEENKVVNKKTTIRTRIGIEKTTAWSFSGKAVAGDLFR